MDCDQQDAMTSPTCVHTCTDTCVHVAANNSCTPQTSADMAHSIRCQVTWQAVQLSDQCQAANVASSVTTAPPLQHTLRI
jgi:hypothetical protein